MTDPLPPFLTDDGQLVGSLEPWSYTPPPGPDAAHEASESSASPQPQQYPQQQAQPTRIAPKATAAAGPALPTAGQRTCVTCRRRKVKCDKLSPCSNCVRGHLACSFPLPVRAPRKPPRKGVAAAVSPEHKALVERLRALEGVVQNLSGADKPQGVAGASPGADDDADSRSATPGDHVEAAAEAAGLDKGFGRLVIEEGKSTYGITPLLDAILLRC